MSSEIQTITNIAHRAGSILLKYYGGELDVQYKMDKFDPVTRADTEADTYLRQAISNAFPVDEILSEEHKPQPNSYAGRVWMVDPLDGTKDFVGGRESFSIIIGLYQNNQPELGVVYAPVSGDILYAQRDKGAYRVRDGSRVRLRVGSNTDLRQAKLVTRNHVSGDVRPLDQQVDNLPVSDRVPEGSIGLKIGRIADGSADVFVHTNLKACKWDTLGSEIILTEAGGVITDLEGTPLDYSKPTVDWDKYFIAANNSDMIQQVLQLIKLPA